LLLLDAGLPAPDTQIPVVAHYWTVPALDMGWERFKVAAEYGANQYRSDMRQYVRDVHRLKAFEACSWIVVRVIAEVRRDDVVRWVRQALHSRGYRDT